MQQVSLDFCMLGTILDSWNPRKSTNKSSCLSEIHSVEVGEQETNEIAKNNVLTFRIDRDEVFWKHRGQDYANLWGQGKFHKEATI